MTKIEGPRAKELREWHEIMTRENGLIDFKPYIVSSDDTTTESVCEEIMSALYCPNLDPAERDIF